jgi:HSP20 family protein
MSFFRSLKTKGVKTGNGPLSSSEEMSSDAVVQLDVDLYQTDEMIVVYAQSSGVDINDVHVSIEGDGDIVIIEGKRIRPEKTAFLENDLNGAFFTKECIWGEFYRRIILPESVDIEQANARIKDGVLVLTLPRIKEVDKKGVRMKIIKTKQRKRM